MNQPKIDLSKPVAVVGAGLVSAGWAIAFARAGLRISRKLDTRFA